MDTVNRLEYFVGRQSILDRNQELAGFELLFRSSQKNSSHFLNNVTATCEVINHVFNEQGFHRLLGKHRGFINVDDQMLMDDTLELLPKEKVVIELLETIEVNTTVVERCKYLKSMGYMLALDDVDQNTGHLEPLRDCIDIIKIDLKLTGMGDDLEKTLTRLSGWSAKLLAEKVDTREVAKRCIDIGFHLFQGFYFAKPIIITGKRLSHSELALMRLLKLVMSEAETDQIAEIFKQNPDLTYNLLRLSNSAAMGLRFKITSASNAITMLGRRQLRRWLQLLIYTKANNSSFPDPLLQLAATRGKAMELLVQNFDNNSKELEDRAFMVGIMSLMHTLLGIPLAEAISPLNPPEEVRDALLLRVGLLGKLLLLIEHLEQYDMEKAGQLLEELAPLNVEQLNKAHLEALAWSNSFEEADEDGG